MTLKYNIHGVQEQLKLLQGLGSLLRHQISAIYTTKDIVEWLPWLQTTWRDSSSGWFTLGLETSCIKQLEEAGPDYLTGITIIILQILTTKHLWESHLLPSGHENFHDDSVVVTLWMLPGLSVRKSGPAAWKGDFFFGRTFDSQNSSNCAKYDSHKTFNQQLQPRGYSSGTTHAICWTLSSPSFPAQYLPV